MKKLVLLFAITAVLLPQFVGGFFITSAIDDSIGTVALQTLCNGDEFVLFPKNIELC